jgi:predicted mannosyl-3-phosphoglycerate phosphatase (HAD superfamily)
MQDGREQDGQEADSVFGRWRARLAQALLREPSVVLIERDADALLSFSGLDDGGAPLRETVN